LLIHATNSIAGILYEIRNAPQGIKISLQWLSTVPVEKNFGVTIMHRGRHQTLAAIITTTEIGAAMKFVYPYVQVKNRALAYGEIVDASRDLPDMEISPFVLAEAVLCVVDFLAHMPCAVDFLSHQAEDQVYYLLGKLMSDELMPFAESKISLVSCPERQSLCQELKGAASSARRVIVLSKSDIAGAIGGRKAINPPEKELGHS
jgi:hypothetical protein